MGKIAAPERTGGLLRAFPTENKGKEVTQQHQSILDERTEQKEEKIAYDGMENCDTVVLQGRKRKKGLQSPCETLGGKKGKRSALTDSESRRRKISLKKGIKAMIMFQGGAHKHFLKATTLAIRQGGKTAKIATPQQKKVKAHERKIQAWPSTGREKKTRPASSHSAKRKEKRGSLVTTAMQTKNKLGAWEKDRLPR